MVTSWPSLILSSAVIAVALELFVEKTLPPETSGVVSWSVNLVAAKDNWPVKFPPLVANLDVTEFILAAVTVTQSNLLNSVDVTPVSYKSLR